MSDIKQIGHWINGGEVAGTGREQDVFNPATGEVSGRVALASVSDLEQAVDAARAALPAWRATGLTKRAAVMFKLREIVTAKSDELARIITAEHGKVVSDAAGEVVRGLLDRMGHLPPEALAGVTIYGNSSHTLRAIEAAFHEAGPVLLPRLRLLAEIETRINQQNAEPRRRYVSPATREVTYATYYDRLRRPAVARVQITPMRPVRLAATA